MATRKQKRDVSDRVVSVRLPEATIERLDALAARTSRSRGTYLRLMIEAMLPLVEDEHWAQQTARVEEKIFEKRFREIAAQFDKGDTSGK